MHSYTYFKEENEMNDMIDEYYIHYNMLTIIISDKAS